jgi:radical SAM protein with 4Fe4S-binding SPASM domain
VLRLGEARDRWGRIGIDADEYAAFLRDAIRLALCRSAPLDTTRHRFLNRVLGSPDGWRTACTSRRCGCGKQFLVVEGKGRRAPCPKFAGPGPGSERIPDRTGDCALPTDLPGDAAAALGELPTACRACPWQRFCGGGCALSGAQDPMCAAYRATFEAIFEEILPAVAGPGSAAPGGAFELQRLEFGKAEPR